MTTAPAGLPRYAVVRHRKRARYDEATVHAILDEGFVAHVAFLAEGRPMVIPMAYARHGSTLYLHGAVATRIVKERRDGEQLCLAVTLVDGIVVARSAFNHSINYRSVVVHGRARLPADEEKELALNLVTDHLLRGRWREVRPMTEKEKSATGVVAFDIEAATAKVREGGPLDEAADLDLPIWSGVVPVHQTFGEPVQHDTSGPARELPASVVQACRGRRHGADGGCS